MKIELVLKQRNNAQKEQSCQAEDSNTPRTVYATENLLPKRDLLFSPNSDRQTDMQGNYLSNKNNVDNRDNTDTNGNNQQTQKSYPYIEFIQQLSKKDGKLEEAQEKKEGEGSNTQRENYNKNNNNNTDNDNFNKIFRTYNTSPANNQQQNNLHQLLQNKRQLGGHSTQRQWPKQSPPYSVQQLSGFPSSRSLRSTISSNLNYVGRSLPSLDVNTPSVGSLSSVADRAKRVKNVKLLSDKSQQLFLTFDDAKNMFIFDHRQEDCLANALNTLNLQLSLHSAKNSQQEGTQSARNLMPSSSSSRIDWKFQNQLLQASHQSQVSQYSSVRETMSRTGLLSQRNADEQPLDSILSEERSPILSVFDKYAKSQQTAPLVDTRRSLLKFTHNRFPQKANMTGIMGKKSSDRSDNTKYRRQYQQQQQDVLLTSCVRQWPLKTNSTTTTLSGLDSTQVKDLPHRAEFPQHSKGKTIKPIYQLEAATQGRFFTTVPMKDNETNPISEINTQQQLKTQRTQEDQQYNEITQDRNSQKKRSVQSRHVKHSSSHSNNIGNVQIAANMITTTTTVVLPQLREQKQQQQLKTEIDAIIPLNRDNMQVLQVNDDSNNTKEASKNINIKTLLKQADELRALEKNKSTESFLGEDDQSDETQLMLSNLRLLIDGDQKKGKEQGKEEERSRKQQVDLREREQLLQQLQKEQQQEEEQNESEPQLTQQEQLNPVPAQNTQIIDREYSPDRQKMESREIRTDEDNDLHDYLKSSSLENNSEEEEQV